MAVVLVGVYQWTGRAVAIKFLHPTYGVEPDIVKRFMDEARAAAQLKHPNVVDVLDMGEEPDGTVYLVLELLSGETLSSLLRRRGKLSPRETLDIMLPVMNAVGHAHARHIVHRDIKPDNIFLADTPGVDVIVPKVLDFGVAKIRSPGSNSSTGSGAVLGTPA